MTRLKLGAVRPFATAAVLTLLAVPTLAQMVERERTFASLTAVYPCNAGSSGRNAIVTDCQSASDIGGGGGSVRCFAHCDGSAPWEAVSIGGGGGVTGLTSCADGTALADNALMRADGTAKCQGSTVTVADSTGDLQWEGTTADAFEGNFTFADPTADWTWAWGADGTLTGATQFNLDNLRLDGNTLSSTDTNGNINLTPNGTGSVIAPVTTAGGTAASLGMASSYGFSFKPSGNIAILSNSTTGRIVFIPASGDVSLGSGGSFGWTSGTNGDPDYQGLDTSLKRSAAGVVKVTDGSTGIRGLLGGGTAVDSATALPVPTGRVFHVTGTTNITSITATNLQSGVCITLIFDDVLTFTDGNNLKLAGDFVTTADDTWHGCYDGTNFYEEGRSIN